MTSEASTKPNVALRSSSERGGGGAAACGSPGVAGAPPPCALPSCALPPCALPSSRGAVAASCAALTPCSVEYSSSDAAPTSAGGASASQSCEMDTRGGGGTKQPWHTCARGNRGRAALRADRAPAATLGSAVRPTRTRRCSHGRNEGAAGGSRSRRRWPHRMRRSRARAGPAHSPARARPGWRAGARPRGRPPSTPAAARMATRASPCRPRCKHTRSRTPRPARSALRRAPGRRRGC
mmetsp:Transcript_35736/g.104587  ORF Transcript_35736/g.104587 Transcript_35736/m.104587 type:complete len:238 (-) Transcript_35736:228-941(-)